MNTFESRIPGEFVRQVRAVPRPFLRRALPVRRHDIWPSRLLAGIEVWRFGRGPKAGSRADRPVFDGDGEDGHPPRRCLWWHASG